jgi:hypothetical protein
VTIEIEWGYIIHILYDQRFLPIISNLTVNNLLFGSSKDVVQAWADDIGYPMPDNQNLSRVARFASVLRDDSERAKWDYLEFLKLRLLQLAEEDGKVAPETLNRIEREARNLTFSQLTERLGYFNFDETPDNPVAILAALGNVPIYLTTSYHRYVEAALAAVGKMPHTKIYFWRERLWEKIPSEYTDDLDFEPSIQEPLVYHLHGIDNLPESLVLTEDDYLEFLVNITRDLRDAHTIPSSIRTALATSMLFLLGYEMNAWDLQVLFQGLIRIGFRRPRSFAVMPEMDNVKITNEFLEYLHKYFGQANFDVYWGDPGTFMQKLWEEFKVSKYA